MSLTLLLNNIQIQRDVIQNSEMIHCSLKFIRALSDELSKTHNVALDKCAIVRCRDTKKNFRISLITEMSGFVGATADVYFLEKHIEKLIVGRILGDQIVVAVDNVFMSDSDEIGLNRIRNKILPGFVLSKCQNRPDVKWHYSNKIKNFKNWFFEDSISRKKRIEQQKTYNRGQEKLIEQYIL